MSNVVVQNSMSFHPELKSPLSTLEVKIDQIKALLKDVINDVTVKAALTF